MKSIIIKMKISIQGLNRRIEKAGEFENLKTGQSRFEDESVEFT